MKIYDSLHRGKVDLVLKNNTVKMYSCGPTVYSYAHIGNMRAYIFMDILRRTIVYNGYTLDSVMNITDVGHLTSDADTGEDKMELAARREQRSVYEIAEHYTEFFFRSITALNIQTPEHICRATQYVPSMVAFIRDLESKGHAYENASGVYFDVSTFAGYGMLSGVALEDKLAGARIEVDASKRNPQDFALWIKADKSHIMQWPSPWGMGYPGWHIECSAMSKDVLGEDIDIHTGGIDHLPVHHENEIAQSDACSGHQVVKHWMHCGFLKVDGGKMSKSLGNCYTVDELTAKGYDPLAFRYFCLNTHYRKTINFTFETLAAAQTALDRLRALVIRCKDATSRTTIERLSAYRQEFLDAINDDLNVPKAIGNIWTLLSNESPSEEIYNMLLEFDRVLGVDIAKPAATAMVPDDILAIAENRRLAREGRDYHMSDVLRDQLKDMGYNIKDGKDNTYEIERI